MLRSKEAGKAERTAEVTKNGYPGWSLNHSHRNALLIDSCSVHDLRRVVRLFR